MNSDQHDVADEIHKPKVFSLDELKANLSSKSPIEVAFEIAIDNLSSVVTVIADEEIITAALMGGVIAAYPLCILISDEVESKERGNESANDFYWANYSKNARGPTSESVSGADFAIVVCVEKKVRLSIFQAKKGHLTREGNHAINLYRKRVVRSLVDDQGLPSESVVVVQLQSLINAGKNLVKDVSGPDDSVGSNLRWIHYLGYFKEKISCLHLSEIDESVIAIVENGTEADSDVVLCSKNSRDWIDVIRSGLRDNAERWWLDLEFDDLKTVVPQLISLMNIVVFDDGSGGRFLTFGNQDKMVGDKKICRRKRPSLSNSQVDSSNDQATSINSQKLLTLPPEDAPPVLPVSSETLSDWKGRRGRANEKADAHDADDQATASKKTDPK